MSGFFEYLIENKAVYTGLEAGDWRDALLKGGQYLVDNHVAEKRYITTMIEKVEDVGPYFILAPGIAMPHGRPEEGVIETGYSLVILKEPVAFGDEDSDPIWMLIYMAAKDKKTHNETAIVQIAELCDRDDIIEKIKKSSDRDEILEIIKQLHNEIKEL